MSKTHFDPSTLETIDQAFLDFVKELDIHARTNKGWVPTPVVWTGAERAYQTKKDLRLRDSAGVLILPQMTVRRNGTGKSLTFKGKYFAAVPDVNDKKGGMHVSWTKRINSKKTSDFERARSLRKTGKLNFKAVAPLRENEKIVYEHISIPGVVYLSLEYTIVLRTEYQEQMNQILSPFLIKSGNHKYFLIKNAGWKYECFFDDDYGQNDNVENFDEEERMFKSEIKVKVLGYIMGSGENDPKPTKTIRENPVELSIGEVVLTAQEAAVYFGDD